MIVLDAVIVKPPYSIQDCSAKSEKQDVLNRVRKVLDGERKKLKEKEERDRKPVAPVEPRKGG